MKLHREQIIRLTITLFLLSALTACGNLKSKSQLDIDSAHAIALDGTIPQGLIYSKTKDMATLTSEITKQLFYTIGQFNQDDGVGDLNRLQISIDEANIKNIGTDLFEIPYAAKFVVAWPREREIPQKYVLYLPKKVDYEAEYAFYQMYSEICAEGSSHMEFGNFWYFYRPRAYNCPIASRPDDSLVLSFDIQLQKSVLNTEGKSPEYSKVWQDGRLVVTAIFGQNELGQPTAWDPGIEAFNSTYKKLVAAYGKPKYSNIPDPTSYQIAPTYRDVNIIFDVPGKGELDVRLMSVEGILYVGPEFQQIYNERTKNSDLITYSGHSGLGANIRALTRMGSFQNGQYQLFLINGCDTFAYVDNSLRDAHAAVNPDQPVSKYFDLIVNAMPSFFSMNAHSNMTLINALVDAKKTYRDILAEFDESQRALVTGEEDND